MTSLIEDLRARAQVRSLLSRCGSNPKIARSQKLGILTAILHLAPGRLSGHEVCPRRSPGCTRACLNFAGAAHHLPGKLRARIARTKLLFADRALFLNLLVLEIDQHIRRARRQGLAPAVRLNGTSDLLWETMSVMLFPVVQEALGDRRGTSLFALFPEIRFYDYTAIPGRCVPPNYHLTFSLKENNLTAAILALAGGTNLAVVFEDDLPNNWMGHRVVDGDVHDYRPADPHGVIIGLRAKGRRGRNDDSGFVRRQVDAMPEVARAA